MSLREEPRSPTIKSESKQQRERRLKKRRAEQRQLRERLVDDDDAVLSFREWCRLVGVSDRQDHRILASGNGPSVTRISDRRTGISRKHHRLWLAQRAR